MPDVFAHGMLSAAWLGRLLTDWVPPAAIRSLDVRFAAITHVASASPAPARWPKNSSDDGKRCVRLQLATANQGRRSYEIDRRGRRSPDPRNQRKRHP